MATLKKSTTQNSASKQNLSDSPAVNASPNATASETPSRITQRDHSRPSGKKPGAKVEAKSDRTNIRTSARPDPVSATAFNRSMRPEPAGSAASLRLLTPKEKAVLEFLEQEMVSSGICPSYQEIRDAFGLASFNSVQNYLKQLVSKGYIENPPHLKRAIRILHSASAAQDELQRRLGGSESLSLPMLGKVAAGLPIERIKDNEYVEVPSSMVKKADSTFVLEVEGDSMVDEGIWEGDYLLVQKQSGAKNGEIVVATIDNEATVKRFYMQNTNSNGVKGMVVELRPANPRLKSMWYPPHQVVISGRVVGLIRKY